MLSRVLKKGLPWFDKLTTNGSNPFALSLSKGLFQQPVRRWLGNGRRGQRGFSMVETVVTIGLLATIFTVAMGGIAVGARAALLADKRVTAEMLARSQFESIKNQAYVAPPGTYPLISAPSGYSIAVATSSVPGGDANMELVQVTVSKDGQQVRLLEGYKVSR